MEAIKDIKKCEFGDLVFTIGVNRAMLKDGFTRFPEYWKFIASRWGKEQAADDDALLFDLLFEGDELLDAPDKFVRYLFPKMLEYGENNLLDCLSYDDQANAYIEYLEDNGVWKDYEDEDGNEYDGACSLLHKMLFSVFQTGKTEKKKSNLRLAIN